MSLIKRRQQDRSENTAAKEVLLQGYYGANNLGDELMLSCLDRWLTAQGFTVTVLAENAGRVEELHGIRAEQNYPILGEFAWVESLLRGKAWRIWSAISRCTAFFCGGGDCIRDAIGWRGFTYQVSKIFAAFLFGKPVYLVNIGISRPSTWYGRRILRWMLPRCRRIIVREERSLALCRELGAEEVTVWAPDIVLSLPEFFPVPPSNVAAAAPYIVVALHYNPDIYGGFDMTETRCGNLARALDHLVDAYGLRVFFLPCQTIGTLTNDHEMHRKVAGLMENPQSVTFLDWTVALPEIAHLFAGARMVAAMRLHAVVLAKAFEKSCVVLPYDAKVSDFADQVGFRHVLSAGMLDSVEQAVAVFEAALSDVQPAATPELRRIWPEMTAEAAPSAG